jgi:hypothetical protein
MREIAAVGRWRALRPRRLFAAAATAESLRGIQISEARLLTALSSGAQGIRPSLMTSILIEPSNRSSGEQLRWAISVSGSCRPPRER